MEINHTSILLTLLYSLLGRITPNLRKVTVNYSHDHIHLYFYYHSQSTEEEDELAEEVSSEVLAAAFPDIILKSFEVNKIVIPYPNKIPHTGHPVYHRYEPLLETLLPDTN
jgi:hypothetical protein